MSRLILGSGLTGLLATSVALAAAPKPETAAAPAAPAPKPAAAPATDAEMERFFTDQWGRPYRVTDAVDLNAWLGPRTTGQADR